MLKKVLDMLTKQKSFPAAAPQKGVPPFLEHGTLFPKFHLFRQMSLVALPEFLFVVYLKLNFPADLLMICKFVPSSKNTLSIKDPANQNPLGTSTIPQCNS